MAQNCPPLNKRNYVTLQRKTARRMLTALDAAHWFIENVNEDDPNRTSRFFALRGILSEAQEMAHNAGLTADADGYRIITDDDREPYTVMLMPPQTVNPDRQPYVTHVAAANPGKAFLAAVNGAIEHYQVKTSDPTDWGILLICKGHITNLATA